MFWYLGISWNKPLAKLRIHKSMTIIDYIFLTFVTTINDEVPKVQDIYLKHIWGYFDRDNIQDLPKPTQR